MRDLDIKSLCKKLKPVMGRRADALWTAYPSLKDLERLLFALGQSDDNPKFLTAATAFASLNEILGKTAYIRKAPDISMRYRIIVHDYEGLPLRLCSFLNAVHLLRAQMKASVEGHA